MATAFVSASVLAEIGSSGKLFVIIGPTASGKTEFVSKLADSLSSPVIISADAFQVYRGMDVGTAKPAPMLRERLPHRLIDVVGPEESFSAGRWAEEAKEAITEARGRGETPLVCGGSGLYIKALLHGLHPAAPADPALRTAGLDRSKLVERLAKRDPDSAERLRDAPLPRIIRAIETVEASGRTLAEIRADERPAYEGAFEFIPMTHLRNDLYKRIDERTDEMMRNGFIEEVITLREKGISPDMPSQKAIGYREIHRHLDGKQSLERTVELMKRDTRRYAKRQMTWFRTQFGIEGIEMR
jgi:tRNA dimethylallyltransferase